MEVPSEGQAMKSDYKGKCSGKRSESGQVCKGDMTVTSAARSGIFASDCWPQFCAQCSGRKITANAGQVQQQPWLQVHRCQQFPSKDVSQEFSFQMSRNFQMFQGMMILCLTWDVLAVKPVRGEILYR